VSFNQQQQPYYSDTRAPQAATEGRAKFIERTYIHLAGAIAAFVALEAVFLRLPFADSLTMWALGGGRFNWLLILGAFMLVGKVASSFAHGSGSKGAQYFGLGLYVLAEAVIFIPLLRLAQVFGGPDTIWTAGVTTLAVFAGLTGFVLYTKRDFSFMRGILAVASIGVLLLILGSVIFGFTLGLGFVIGMVVLAAGFILYDTSNVLRHFREDQYVGASLELFASVALMFWYILQLFMSSRE
jgi:FtsH-binding integral membrane protein